MHERRLSRGAFLGAVVGTGAWAGLAGCRAAPAPTTTTTSRPGQPTAGGAIVFVLENDVIDFDPLRSRAFVDRNVHYQIYDSLVRIDPQGTIIPWLAARWEHAPDGMSITFSLRKGVTFHDGSPFDAAAVQWNIDRYRTIEDSARRGELAPIERVDVVDPATVRFSLKAPFAPLLAQLVDRAGMMVSRKAVEAMGPDFTRKAFRAGTGPFILTEAVKDDHIVLQRNPDWWGTDQAGNKLPYLDKITVKPITNSDVRLANLRTGEAHAANNIAGKDVAGLKTDSSLTYQEIPGLSFGSLIPNRRPGFIFNDPRYVKAVAMALNRQEILDKVFFGVGTVGYGPIAPPHFAYDPKFRPFERPDPQGARRLIAEAGSRLEFEFLVSSGDPQTLQLAQLIQAQLAQADIKAEIVQLEFAQILKLQDEKSFKGMTLVGWSGRIDPDANVYDHVVTGRPFNDSSYSNPEVDRLLGEQRSATDEARRRELLRQAEQLFVVDDPARVWYRFGVAQLVTAKRLQGLQPYPDQIIRFQHAWLAK